MDLELFVVLQKNISNLQLRDIHQKCIFLLVQTNFFF